MNPENKVKEYIERAVVLYGKELNHIRDDNGKFYISEILPVAQMLQREEHFNSLNNK